MDASHSPASNAREDRWARLVQDRKFHVTAEIGVWKGAFARALLDSCPAISTYWMIDPWRRLPRWNKPFNVTDEEFEAVYEEDGRLHRDSLWNDSADAARDGASLAH